MKASRNSGSLFLRVPPGGVAFSEVGVFDKSPERQSTSRVGDGALVQTGNRSDGGI
jgi:hypothetical protein